MTAVGANYAAAVRKHRMIHREMCRSTVAELKPPKHALAADSPPAFSRGPLARLGADAPPVRRRRSRVAVEACHLIVSAIFIGSRILSIILSGFGLARRSPWLLIGAALFASPLAFYVGASPMLKTTGFLLPLPLVVAAFVVKKRRWLAVVLVSLVVAATLWLAIAVMGRRVNAAA